MSATPYHPAGAVERVAVRLHDQRAVAAGSWRRPAGDQIPTTCWSDRVAASRPQHPVAILSRGTMSRHERAAS